VPFHVRVKPYVGDADEIVAVNVVGMEGHPQKQYPNDIRIVPLHVTVTLPLHVLYPDSETTAQYAPAEENVIVQQPLRFVNAELRSVPSPESV
jgi:hypothetical protein